MFAIFLSPAILGSVGFLSLSLRSIVVMSIEEENTGCFIFVSGLIERVRGRREWCSRLGIDLSFLSLCGPTGRLCTTAIYPVLAPLCTEAAPSSSLVSPYGDWKSDGQGS